MEATKPLTVFAPEGAPPDEQALAQIQMVMEDERAVAGVLCADHHLGYSMPIGGVVAYDGAISPTGVGFDIACGNKATMTPLHLDDVPPATLARVMDEIARKIEFGIGRTNAAPIDHPLFDQHKATFDQLDRLAGKRQALSQKARAQLGTVGSGNHYVDLLADENGQIWIANHFGSRGLGHTIATGFLNMAAGMPFDHRGKEKEGAVVFDTASEIGQFYIAAMHLAGDYAYAGRDAVDAQVREILGTTALKEVHLHHNFAWLEDGLWIVRKGATPLMEDELAFIGGSMGDGAVIVRRKPDAELSRITSGLEGIGMRQFGDLSSAPHGAGRVMSRTKAAGKMKRSSRYVCQVEGCDYWLSPQDHQEKLTEQKAADRGDEIDGPQLVPAAHVRDGRGGGVRCPHHPAMSLQKRQHVERKSDGVVDWPTVQAMLAAQGVELRGAGADEAPEVYKNLDAVIAAHRNIEVVHRLEPLGVVMAGADIFDPYKD